MNFQKNSSALHLVDDFIHKIYYLTNEEKKYLKKLENDINKEKTISLRYILEDKGGISKEDKFCIK